MITYPFPCTCFWHNAPDIWTILWIPVQKFCRVYSTCHTICPRLCFAMMTSSNGNIFGVTGPLCGEFTGHGEFPTQRPVTRSFDVFFDLRLNIRLSKQPWGWWFETQSWSLWRHCNALFGRGNMIIYMYISAIDLSMLFLIAWQTLWLPQYTIAPVSMKYSSMIWVKLTGIRHKISVKCWHIQFLWCTLS